MRDLRYLSLFLISTMFLPLFACGGDDVDCSFSACGGDPVGTWSMKGVCFDATAFEEQAKEMCAGVNVDVAVDSRGTLEVRADNTYSSDVTTDISISFFVPGGCLLGLPCSVLESDGITCTGDAADGCVCSGVEMQDDTANGTWSSDATTLTFAENGGAPETSLFCVDSNALKVQSIPVEQDDVEVTLVFGR